MLASPPATVRAVEPSAVLTPDEASIGELGPTGPAEPDSLRWAMPEAIRPWFRAVVHQEPHAHSSRPVRFWREGAVGTLAIERRERFNSLDIDAAHALEAAARDAVRHPGVRALVLQGIDGIFCSGADLKFIWAEASATGREYGYYFREIVGSFHRTILELRRAPLPVVVAVDGAAAAGGMGIALGCGDLVVASDRSTFEYAYFKTGLTGAESNTFFLPRLVGPARAARLAFLSPRLTAAQAFELGLVAQVYEQSELASGVRELAAQLAAGPSDAYAAAKRLMNEALGIDQLEAHLERELDELCRAANSADFAEGLAAFFEKRPAQFNGRALESLFQRP